MVNENKSSHNYLLAPFACASGFEVSDMNCLTSASASAGLLAFSSFVPSLLPGPVGVQCTRVGMPVSRTSSSFLKGC